MKYETELLLPCCKTRLPAPLFGVERVTCKCGDSFSPETIIQYNEMRSVISRWREVVNGKAFIQCEEGQGPFVGQLVRDGIKHLENGKE